MSYVHLESWVKQQYKEVSFGKDGAGPFIGKAALKQKLIGRYPMHEQRIRQLVNAIKHQDRPPRSTPASQPTTKSLQTTKITTSPITTLQPNSKPNPALFSIGPDIRPAPSLDSDSGFASHSDNDKTSASSSRGRNIPTLDFQSHSPRSEDGGAALDAFLSTISRPWTLAETSADPENGTLSSSNPKILELQRFVRQVEDLDSAPLKGKTEDALSTLDLQLELLNLPSTEEGSGAGTSTSGVKNAVIFSGDMLRHSDKDELPQYGLLGGCDPHSPTTVVDPRLFLNTNVPFSAFVCGVQGSGKSHTTACMIENCLIPSSVLGILQKPLSALVFNFAEYTSGSSFRPCELAFLASPGSELPSHLRVKKINIFVSPSNYLSLKALYTQIPGVTVHPFLLHPKELNISTMLTLMSVDQTQATPLYMGIVTSILRKMASKTAGAFNYPEFRRQLDGAGLDRKQRDFLDQRLELLESFLDLDNSTTGLKFAAGEVSIIDLSCPFMDASTACVLFKVAMGLYLESDSTVGKVIVLDEAHKYMTNTVASNALTESLMGVIRQQRHYGARVIISTQEPTISPRLIDLCSITFIHRFSSPEWLDVLQRHILVLDEEGERGNKVALLRDIMRLKTGEALVFAPSAILGANDEVEGRIIGADTLIRMRMRKRVSWDGGRSRFSV